jgi:fumarate hydratase class II
MKNQKSGSRVEMDSMGEVDVPRDKLWGAQTQRSLDNFRIGEECLPRSLIRALGIVKRCAALTNMAMNNLDPAIGEAIAAAAQEVIDGDLDDNFPLRVWQTGSGTQSNMNANEVIANLANSHLGGTPGDKAPVHPNDHCNRSQSSNDVFPTAMHIATVEQLHHALMPALEKMRSELEEKTVLWADIIKLGRTHLQDATPLSLGQVTGAFVSSGPGGNCGGYRIELEARVCGAILQ